MLYAAYGSNLHPVRLSERIRSARPVGTSFMPGWSLKCHKRSKDGSAKFNIVAGGDGLYLAIFEISAGDKKILDNIEGVGAGYSAINLAVPGFGDCASYTAEESYINERLQPYSWYKELTTLGARAQRFPRPYRQLLDDIPACEDPDVDRNAANRRIVETVASNGWRGAR